MAGSELHRARWLGVDVGTTAAKAIAFDEHGAALASGSAGYGTTRPRLDHVEQRGEDWVDAVDTGVAEIAAEIDLAEVRAIGITSQVDTHLAVDDDLRPLRPAILWQDLRCTAEVRELNDGLGGPGSTGLPVDASSPVPRAVWLARYEPEVWAATRWLLLPKDYVNARLTGAVAADPHGSFKVVGVGGRYLPGLDAVAGLAGRLAPLNPADRAVGATRRDWHGIAAGTTVATATMDAIGNVLGSGLQQPGDTMVVIGTSLIVGALDGGGTGAPGVVGFAPFCGRCIHAGPTQSGGDTLRWWAAATGHTVEEVLDAAARAEPGATGVVHAPHLMGERAPLWDSEVRGWFTGLHPGAGFPELCRAVLEGVAFSARELVDSVEEAAGTAITELRVSGGGSRSELWCGILADATGRVVRRSGEPDTAVVGAGALAVAAHTGADPWVQGAELARWDLECRPNPGRAELLGDRYAVYRQAYGLLTPMHRDVARPRDRTADPGNR
ncbi:MAG: xylulose kinase [Pseudonocardia sp.]|nr:xylulose kinase [Pseudonocardia sp.]